MKLYIKTGCPWCAAAVEWMQDRGLEFQTVDVLADARAYDHMRNISGQSLTPTLEMRDGSVLPDFDTGQLETFLKGKSD